MTPGEAKGIVRTAIGPEPRLTARTVSFEDLARGECVFVTIHGAVPDLDAVKRLAVAHGFRVMRAGGDLAQ